MHTDIRIGLTTWLPDIRMTRAPDEIRSALMLALGYKEGEQKLTEQFL
jgi:hypothetical protein